jgi:uncharacterized protein (TIGR03663 family)
MSDDGDVAADGATSAATEDGATSASAADDPGGSTGRLRALAGRLDVAPTTLRFVLGATLVGLVARLVRLGARGAHYDEGRVAYWTLRYARSGHFEYRYIIHGPLVQHLDRWLFAVVGPSDVVARLPVAIVGAALPLVALWFRDHLDDVEVAGMAALLAVNPILLYYSRFMRSDLLVATFMLAALGALVRLRATRRPRYLYAAAALAALGFASKENAVVYVLCWLGAGALLLEVRLFRPEGHATGVAMVRHRLADLRAAALDDGWPASWVRRGAAHLVGAGTVFALVTLVLFAPRAGSVGGPGLWRAVGDPTHLPALLRATGWDLATGYGYWFGGAADAGCRKETLPTGYACYLGRMARTVGQFATATGLLAAVGFLRERYAVADARPLVLFAGFWGVASFFGYPLGTDIWAAWVVSHVVVPLTIPAAAGLAAAVRLAGRGLATDRDALVAVPVALLVVLGVWTAGVAVGTSYVDDAARDHPGDMVQYAQPQDGIGPAVDAMATAVEGHDDGPDVVYYGSRFHLTDEAAADQPPVPDDQGNWFDRLPLPWYTEAIGAETASAREATALAGLLEGRPPVVVADAGSADAVVERVEGYRTYRFDLRAPVDGPSERTTVVVFVDERRLDDGG